MRYLKSAGELVEGFRRMGVVDAGNVQERLCVLGALEVREHGLVGTETMDERGPKVLVSGRCFTLNTNVIWEV